MNSAYPLSIRERQVQAEIYGFGAGDAFLDCAINQDRLDRSVLNRAGLTSMQSRSSGVSEISKRLDFSAAVYGRVVLPLGRTRFTPVSLSRSLTAPEVSRCMIQPTLFGLDARLMYDFGPPGAFVLEQDSRLLGCVSDRLEAKLCHPVLYIG